jgi:hypothetical protein
MASDQVQKFNLDVGMPTSLSDWQRIFPKNNATTTHTNETFTRLWPDQVKFDEIVLEITAKNASRLSTDPRVRFMTSPSINRTGKNLSRDTYWSTCAIAFHFCVQEYERWEGTALGRIRYDISNILQQKSRTIDEPFAFLDCRTISYTDVESFKKVNLEEVWAKNAAAVEEREDRKSFNVIIHKLAQHPFLSAKNGSKTKMNYNCMQALIALAEVRAPRR